MIESVRVLKIDYFFPEAISITEISGEGIPKSIQPNELLIPLQEYDGELFMKVAEYHSNHLGTKINVFA